LRHSLYEAVEGKSYYMKHESSEPHIMKESDWATSDMCNSRSEGSWLTSHVILSQFVSATHQRLKQWY